MLEHDEGHLRRWRVALAAHDTREDALVAFVRRHRGAVRDWDVIATASTAERLRDAIGLRLRTTLPGPRGGYLQLAAGVAAGEIDALIFLRDPLARSHEPDVAGLLRLADMHNVAVATNLSSAECIVRALVPVGPELVLAARA
jgi:methylglyoxal synthase